MAQVCLGQTGRKDRRRTHPRSNTRSSLLSQEKVTDCTSGELDLQSRSNLQSRSSVFTGIAQTGLSGLVNVSQPDTLPILEISEIHHDPTPGI